MSEIVPAASTEAGSSSSTPASTPTDTASIAASVIADLESGSDEPAPVAASTEPPTTPEVDPDDFDAAPAERVDALGRKQENRLPHSRVKAMIAKREAKLIGTVAKALGITKAEAELKLDDVLGGVTERGTKLTEFETRFKGIDAIETIMANEPDRFMEMLPTINPGYKAWAKQVAQAAQAAAAQQSDDDPEPEPDFDLGNGQMTYSREGMKKLRAWDRRQGVKEIDAKNAERFKPFEEEAQQKKDRAAQAERQAASDAHLTKRVERARQWPQFKEHETDIFATMDAEKAKGNFITFEDAYMMTVVPKLAGERTKIRQEVLAEINGQPRSSSAASTVTPPAPDKHKTTQDIAREVMAQFDKS